MVEKKCLYCNNTDIAYIDILGIPWCEKCYDEVFLS